MIEINLLPIEDIAEPPTPVARIVSIAVGVALAALSIAYFYSVHAEKNEKIDLLNARKAEVARLKKLKIEERHAEVKKIAKTLEDREEAIQKIHLLRTEMSRKLHQFAGILDAGSHPVWLTSLKIDIAKAKRQARDRRSRRSKKSESKIELPKFSWESKAECAGEKLTPGVALFQAIRADTDFYRDFTGTVTPQYDKIELDEEYEEKVGFKFNVEMTMQMKREVKQPRRKRPEQKPDSNDRRNPRNRPRRTR